jgi:hypothetical protein
MSLLWTGMGFSGSNRNKSLITTKASSAALPSLASPCDVLSRTPQSSLLGALHLTPCW